MESKRGRIRRVKYWEIIADNLHNAGWSLGWVSALDLEGQTVWIVDAHGYGKRFIVRAHEKLTAFMESAHVRQFRPRARARPSGTPVTLLQRTPQIRMPGIA